ncbi:MAG: ATP-binding protein [Bacteroidales bacterium]
MRIRILILLIPACFLAAGQELVQYNLSDGLSSIEVTDIKENDNYLWVATSDGLNRFDGSNFKVYKNDRIQKNSISSNNIETLFFDSRGLLWIGLKTGGCDIYDPRKDYFYKLNEVINIPSPNRVISIFEDSKNTVWLGTWEQGLFQLDPLPGDSVKFKAKVHYPGYIVSALMEKPKGYLRIGTYYGLIVYNIYKKKWTDLGNQDKAITQFLKSSEENGLWASSWSSGLLKITWSQDSPESPLIRESLSGKQVGAIYRLLELDNHELLLGTWGKGLMQAGLKSPQKIARFRNGDFTPSFINCLFQDRYQNIWIGTFGEGLYRLISGNSGIYHFPSSSKLSKPAVSLAPVGESQILVGTQGSGIYKVDFAKKSIEQQFQGVFTGNFKSYILTIYSNRNNFFIGHDGSGIQFGTKISTNKILLKDYSFSPQMGKGNVFFMDNNHTVWLGTKQNGLISFTIDPATHFLENYQYYPDLGREMFTGIVPYNEDKLFISSQAGLCVFNKYSGTIDMDNGFICHDPVNRIIEDNKNKCLWVGTSTNLFYVKYNQPDSLYTPFSSGILPQGTIRTMILDAHNNLWFSIGERLFCKMDETNKLREISPEMTGNHTILSSTVITDNGIEKLVFGTSDDLIVLDPDFLLRQPEESKILLTKLEIDHKIINVGDELYGNVVLKNALEYSNTLSLSHKCKWISLSFIESGYDIFNTNYQFRIKNFSEKWQFINLKNPVTFSQLMPGNYVLEIGKPETANSSNVVWSLDLEILPPWWATRIFRFFWAFTFLFLVVTLVFILNSRYKQKHQERLRIIEKEKEEELLREKESFFSGLSHDLLTTFSLILAPVSDLIRDTKLSESGREKLEIIKKNTSFLSDMFGAIFDFKRAEFSDKEIKENNIELVSFLQLILNAFEYLATSRNIKLHFRSNVKMLNVRIDNVKVERILYNLLSNAIKYTPDHGEVSLEMNYEESGEATFIVKDNGRGMDLENQDKIFEKFYRDPAIQNLNEPRGLGLGLYIVKKFVTIIGGTVTVDSQLHKGTTVTVHIPIRLEDKSAGSDLLEAGNSLSDDKSTIIVVEDNKQLLGYISGKLESFFNVIPVQDSEKALHSIKEYLPEIVITDIIMPGMDGLALTKAIKSNAMLSDIFVVVLSAKSSTEDELEGYKQGVDIYLKKPIDPEILLNQMINIHTTRQKRKAQIITNLVSREEDVIEFGSKETFFKWAIQIIETHLMDADFTMDDFAAEMNISKSVLHRKFKLLIGQTPNQFLKIIRLRKAVELLKVRELSVSEIAYRTGFNQSHYFIKCFKEVYNQTPKSYRDKVLTE